VSWSLDGGPWHETPHPSFKIIDPTHTLTRPQPGSEAAAVARISYHARRSRVEHAARAFFTMLEDTGRTLYVPCDVAIVPPVLFDRARRAAKAASRELGLPLPVSWFHERTIDADVRRYAERYGVEALLADLDAFTSTPTRGAYRKGLAGIWLNIDTAGDAEAAVARVVAHEASHAAFDRQRGAGAWDPAMDGWNERKAHAFAADFAERFVAAGAR
jgi:hypothetical protein